MKRNLRSILVFAMLMALSAAGAFVPARPVSADTPVTFIITASAAAHGSISPSGPIVVDSGSKKSFTITPKAGYYIAEVSVDGVPLSGTLPSYYEFSDVTADHSIAASFAINPTTATLIVNAGIGGSVTPRFVDSTMTVVPAFHTVTSGSTDNTFTVTYGAAVYFDVNAGADHLVETVNLGTPANPTVSRTVNRFMNIASFELRTTFISAAWPRINYTWGDGGQIATIDTQSGNASKSTGNPYVIVRPGTSQTLYVVPNIGWKLVGVTGAAAATIGTGNDPNVTSFTFTTTADQTSSYTINATFAKKTFTLTPTVTANGTVSPSIAQTVNYGDSQTFTITPATGYHIASVSVDGVTVSTPNVDSNGVAIYPFSNVMAPHTINTTFAINAYIISTNTAGSGSITGPATVNYGDTPLFTITPVTGYHITSITVNGHPVMQPYVDANGVGSYTFSPVTGNSNISATFEVNSYILTYTAGANGNINGTSPQTITFPAADGTAVTAVPNPGYHFTNWSPGGSTANPRTDTNVTANLSVTANFAADSLSITVTHGSNGSITGPTTVNYGEPATFTITAATGFHVADVLVDGASVGPKSSYTFDRVTDSTHTISATFAINQYILTYTAGAGGAISGTSPQTVEYNTSGRAVTPNSNPSYHFVNWSDGSTANPRTDLNVKADINVTANFAPDISGSRGLKQSVIKHLTTVVRPTTTDKQDLKSLDDAILHLKNSIAEPYWKDDTHLVIRTGNKVFQEEKDAEVKLVDLAKSNHSTIPASALMDDIKNIAAADRILADQAISDAKNGDAKQINQATQDLNNGDSDVKVGKYVDSIEHYRNAWKHAQQAVKSTSSQLSDDDDSDKNNGDNDHGDSNQKNNGKGNNDKNK